MIQFYKVSDNKNDLVFNCSSLKINSLTAVTGCLQLLLEYGKSE